MSEAARQERPVTVGDFLAFGGEPDVRYELVAGEIRAMAPASDRHGVIAANATVAIRTRLRDRPPCRPRTEAGIRISEEDCYIADVAVSCREAGDAPGVTEPLLLVEVLSPGTRAHDLGTKLPAYKEIPSVREIWLVDSTRRWVEHWVREEEGWRGHDVIGNGRLESPVLEDTVTLDELYEASGL